ncbi:hypothetical protein ONE63_007787 [Megalurothrips usitatus]|uniref:Uncharacterized protein n=1 Tax=Megalurothrips usitatus TaxID=439358 RepID=A0AAV7XR97_9NEOP|nr:hypothetical protein ONE63_007787 [Megalurothrips usitatus]
MCVVVRPGLLDEVPPRLARPGRPLVRHGQDGRRLVQDVVHAQRLGGPRARRLRAAPLRPRPQQGGCRGGSRPAALPSPVTPVRAADSAARWSSR